MQQPLFQMILPQMTALGVNPAENQHSRAFLLQQPIAHRGLFDDIIPENSLAAFAAAEAAQCSIELDVQLSKDQHIMIFHDDTLLRMTGVRGRIQDYTLRQLKQLRLKQTIETIPTLAEVLHMLNGSTGLLIEIKYTPQPAIVSQKLWQMAQHYQGPWAMESFDPRCVAWFAKNASQVPRGVLAERLISRAKIPTRNVLSSRLLLNSLTHPNFIAYRIGDLPNDSITLLRSMGLPVIAWTIRNKETLEKAIAYCDNIIFDSLLPNELGIFSA